MKALSNYILERSILANAEYTIRDGDNIVNELDALRNTVANLKNYENKSKGKYKCYRLDYKDCKNLLNSLGCDDCYISIEVTEDNRTGAAKLSQYKNMVFVWIMRGKDIVLSNKFGCNDCTNIKSFVKDFVVPIFNGYDSFSNFIHRK